ncbi:Gfo/Idh/MocA family protein [Microbacterium sp. ZW T5_56]|uniref:Gfo/Idh/MocA family protein n=1 Tax=Microbacterium sp. ZW T5_56 TaxID=3378081 RepID=UPI0038538145
MTSDIEVGIVGTGSMAVRHLASWRELGAEPIVWSPRSAADFAAAHRTRTTSSFAELLAAVQVLDVTSPTLTHPEYVLAAVGAGVDVICEKPLARTGAEADALVEAARQAGVLLYPAHVVRAMTPWADARDHLRAGRIGEVRSAAFTRIGEGPDAPWFHDHAASGGAVMDLFIHDLDVAEWMLGRIVRISGTEESDPARRRHLARLVLEHENGVTSTIEGGWTGTPRPFHAGFAIDGTAGSLSWPIAADDSNDPVSGIPGEDPYTRQLRDALAARDGSVPVVTAEDGARAVHLAEGALHAVRTGEVSPL